MRKKEPLCPLLKKPCIEHECMWFTHVTGKHPQTGAELDTWDCAIRWTPIVAIEQAKQTYGVQAAVESMRNEVVARQDNLNNALMLAAKASGTARQIGRQPDGTLIENEA